MFGCWINIWFVSSGFGVRLRSPFSALHGFSAPSLTIKDDCGIEEVRDDDVPLVPQMPEKTLGDVIDAFAATGDSV